MRATVKDVAVLAGVSPKTVSNVITGAVPVRPETKERVERALSELDYVPNLSARGLRNGRSGVIALALPDLAKPYSAEMAHHFVEAAHERGWGIQLEETGGRPDREAVLLSRARARMVDGLVLNPEVSDEIELPSDESQLPAAVIIGEVVQDRIDQVVVEPVQAAFDMTTLLISLGHRRIAVVGSPLQRVTFTAMLRTEGYRRALAAAGIPHDPALEIGCETWSAHGGARAVSAFLDSRRVPDAFFCFTDTIAKGVLSELWSRGIQVPRGVSVAGFDDVAESAFATPPLTTVGFDKSAFAATTLDKLEARIAHRDAPVGVTKVPHTLIQRGSTSPR